MQVNGDLIGFGLFFIVFGGGPARRRARAGSRPTSAARRLAALAAPPGRRRPVDHPARPPGALARRPRRRRSASGRWPAASSAPGRVCRSSAAAADEAGTPFERAVRRAARRARRRRHVPLRRPGRRRPAAGSSWTVEGASADGTPPTIERDGERRHDRAGRRRRCFGFGGDARALGRHAADRSDDRPRRDAQRRRGRLDARRRPPRRRSTRPSTPARSGSTCADVAAASTLDGTVNAGSAVVWLPELPLEGDLTVNAGSLVDLRARRTSACGWSPATTRSRRTTSTTQGLVRIRRCAGRRRASPRPPIRIELEVQANAGSMSLNPRQTCCGLTRRCRPWNPQLLVARRRRRRSAASALLVRGFGGYREAARISDTSPSRISSIAVGEVLVSGVVEPAELTLVSPLQSAPCVFYRSRIDETGDDDGIGRRSARRRPSGSGSATTAASCASSRAAPGSTSRPASTSGPARSATTPAGLRLRNGPGVRAGPRTARPRSPRS